MTRFQIFLWVLKDNDLTGMAFIDTQLYIHQMFSIKNFILAADLMKSISLLRYQESSKTLSLVSRVSETRQPPRTFSVLFVFFTSSVDSQLILLTPWQDAKPLEVYSIEFMVDNNQLGFLGRFCDVLTLESFERRAFLPTFFCSSTQCRTETRTCTFTCICPKVRGRHSSSDTARHTRSTCSACGRGNGSNLYLFSFFLAKESFGGMRLLRRADFNAGANINTFWRMPCRGALDGSSKKALTWDNKHITWFGRLHHLGT